MAKQEYLLKSWIIFLIILTTLLISAISFGILFQDRIYPGVYIADMPFFGESAEGAQQKLAGLLSERTKNPVVFTYQHPLFTKVQQYEVDLSKSLTQESINEAVNQAMEYGPRRPFLPPARVKVKINFDRALKEAVENLGQEVNQYPLNAQIKVVGEQINVTPSQEGWVLDQKALTKVLDDYLNSSSLVPLSLPVKKAYPKFSYETALQIKQRLDQIKLSPLVLKYKDQSFALGLTQTLSLLDLENSESALATAYLADRSVSLISVEVDEEEFVDTRLSINQDQMRHYLEGVASRINRPVVEPLFVFDPGTAGQSKVKEFRPPQDGLTLDIDEASILLAQALLTANQTTIELPVKVIAPKNKLTNDLGIKERIGTGLSNFSGSIANRIYNIELAASRINGVLIPPGETFSFNNTVGEISAVTGYKQAYVIKSGRTVLDDGGGVCQVSTTLFRAVLNTGLPIITRTAHAYRVSYYEQGFSPGLDATVYSPSVDFQFKNDTPAHILVQARVSGTSLKIDLFGTSDGRVSKVTTPVILSQTPPLPEIRQEDPSLPRGTTKQVDWSAWGANVVFTRTVTLGEKTLINETFRSNYRPWQAVFLVGTKDN